MTHKVNPQFLWGSLVNHKIISVDYILVRLLNVLAKSNHKTGWNWRHKSNEENHKMKLWPYSIQRNHSFMHIFELVGHMNNMNELCVKIVRVLDRVVWSEMTELTRYTIITDRELRHHLHCGSKFKTIEQATCLNNSPPPPNKHTHTLASSHDSDTGELRRAWNTWKDHSNSLDGLGILQSLSVNICIACDG